MSFPNVNPPNLQTFEAIQCPFCSKIYVESLWSLIAHFDMSHGEEQTSFRLSLTNLQRIKKIVPRNLVSIIRPAFNENGDPTEFLSMLLSNSSTNTVAENSPTSIDPIQCSPQANSILSVQEPNVATTKLFTPTIPNIPQQIPIKEAPEIPIMDTSLASISANIEPRRRVYKRKISENPAEVSIKIPQTLNEDLIGPQPDPIKSKIHVFKKVEPEDQQEQIVIIGNDFTLNGESPLTSQSEVAPQIFSFSPQNTCQEPRNEPKNRVNRRDPKTKVSHSKLLALTCNQCGMQFENRCKLTRHTLDHKMAENPYRCSHPNCLQSYDNRNKFRTHLIRCHRYYTLEEIENFVQKGELEERRLKGRLLGQEFSKITLNLQDLAQVKKADVQKPQKINEILPKEVKKEPISSIDEE